MMRSNRYRHDNAPVRDRGARHDKFAAAFLIGLFVVALFPTPSAVAEDRAHQHGIGHLDIAIQDGKVEMELTVPGSDAVGFEHAATTAADRRAVNQAVHNFEDGKALFAFPAAARCRFEEVEVRSGLIDDHGGHGHHGHGKKDQHHDESSAPEETHAEFTAHYHLDCDRPAALTYVDVKFFEVFPSAHALASRWISGRGQGGRKLTRSANRLAFQN